jgi:hypothetical protein
VATNAITLLQGRRIVVIATVLLVIAVVALALVALLTGISGLGADPMTGT